MIRWVLLSLVFLLLASCRSAQAPATIPTDTPALAPSIDQPAAAEKTPPMEVQDNPAPTISATPTDQGISLEMDAQIPPIPPPQLSAVWQEGGVMLSWLGTGSDIDKHYIVYRRQSPDDPWQVITQIAVEGDNRGEYRFLDTSAEAGTAYSYAVTTTNQYGKESSQTTIHLTDSP